MGSLILYLPITYTVFLFGSLSLMAAPFLSGMYSKDYILEILSVPHSFSHSFAYLLTLIAASLTSFYSLRVFLKVFLYTPNFSLSLTPYIKDSGILISLPLIILSFFAIFLGYFSHELLLGFGSEYWSNSIFILPSHNRFLDPFNSSSYLPLIPLLFLLPLLLLLFPGLPGFSSFTSRSTHDPVSNIVDRNSTNIPGVLSSIDLHQQNPTEKKGSSSLIFKPFGLLSLEIFRAFHSQNIANYWLMNSYLHLSNSLYLFVDRGILEFLGPLGLTRLFSYLGFTFELLSTRYIIHYILYFITSLVIFFLIISITSIVGPMMHDPSCMPGTLLFWAYCLLFFLL